jgi:hypothetical protein
VKRIVLILIIVAVVMFAVVLKTPLRTIRSVVFPQAEETASQPKYKKDKPDKQKVKRDRAPAVKAAGNPRETDSLSPSARKTRKAEPAQPSRSGRSTDRLFDSLNALGIARNSVGLYAINSVNGSVLAVLRKGMLVEPSLQVTDSSGQWTYVRVPEINAFGFVQTQDVVRLSSSAEPGHKD